nr:hypothetical protein [Paracoccus litorisediminis]
MKEKNQVIDGVNNLDWWLGKSDHTNRNDFIYYEGNTIRAVRLGKWKMHFAISEGFFGNWENLKFPMAINLHYDPFEEFDLETDRTYTNERKQWLMGPIQDLLAAHMKTLAEQLRCRSRPPSICRRAWNCLLARIDLRTGAPRNGRAGH